MLNRGAGRLAGTVLTGLACALWLSTCGSSQSGGSGSPATPPGGPVTPQPIAPPARLLVVTHTTGFRHSSIAIAETTLRTLGQTSRLYDTEFCRNAPDVEALLTPAHLANVDAVFFANTTGDLGIPDLHGFVEWVGAGHAFLGAHSASDTYHDAPEYVAMLGGEFLTHGSIAEADVKVEDPADPAVAHLAPRFRIVDELYRFTGLNRAGVRVLLSLDRNPDDGLGPVGQPADLPLAWHRSHGTGRVFYTALGHREEVWQDPRFQQHLLEAIRWSLQR